MIHTQQRGQKPLKGEVSSKRPHFTHSLRVKPQSHSLCSEAALTTHHHFVSPDPAGLSTHKQFYCFSRPSASRKVNLASCWSSFSHTPGSSGSMQLCATFSAHLEIPFYSPVLQECRTVCIYTICIFTSMFFFLGALQHV